MVDSRFGAAEKLDHIRELIWLAEQSAIESISPKKKREKVIRLYKHYTKLEFGLQINNKVVGYVKTLTDSSDKADTINLTVRLYLKK
jgi:hypothetical protein